MGLDPQSQRKIPRSHTRLFGFWRYLLRDRRTYPWQPSRWPSWLAGYIEPDILKVVLGVGLSGVALSFAITSAQGCFSDGRLSRGVDEKL